MSAVFSGYHSATCNPLCCCGDAGSEIWIAHNQMATCECASASCTDMAILAGLIAEALRLPVRLARATFAKCDIRGCNTIGSSHRHQSPSRLFRHTTHTHRTATIHVHTSCKGYELLLVSFSDVPTSRGIVCLLSWFDAEQGGCCLVIRCSDHRHLALLPHRCLHRSCHHHRLALSRKSLGDSRTIQQLR